MDMLLFPGQNRRAWTETMINLEARQLVNTANMVAAMHLQDGFIRIQFVDEIREFIMSQFEAARRAKTDDDSMACLLALRAENTSLLEQSRSLKTGYAKLYAEVKVVRDENKIVGYIISAVDVVVAGAAIFGGIVMMSTMTPVGVVAGAVIVVYASGELILTDPTGSASGSPRWRSSGGEVLSKVFRACGSGTESGVRSL